MTATGAAISFGIMTVQQHVAYDDLLRVWNEADGIPEIEHAWLFDHLFPAFGDPNGSVFEGWTLLSALAAQTTRLRLGILVTSNRLRPPAMLAKIAATVDVVSGGRLNFAIGMGARPNHPDSLREYAAHGLPFDDWDQAVESFEESCTIIRRLWSEDEPFDFNGGCHHLSGAFCNPKPLQRPTPPILIGGRSKATLRIAAAHADVWNMPGFDLEDCKARSAQLDQLCEEAGRDPSSIVRSVVLRVSYDEPEVTRAAVEGAADAGFAHVVLDLPAPFPWDVGQWVATEIIHGV